MDLQRELHLTAVQSGICLSEQRRGDYTYVIGEVRMVQNIERVNPGVGVDLTIASLKREFTSKVDVDRDLAGTLAGIASHPGRPIVRDTVAIVVLSGRD